MNKTRKGLYLLFAVLMSLFILSTAALADEVSDGIKISDGKATISFTDKTYESNGALNSVTISSNDTEIIGCAQDNEDPNHYHIVLSAGTETGAKVNASFDFTKGKKPNWPFATSEKYQGGMSAPNFVTFVKMNCDYDVIEKNIVSQTEESSSTVYVYGATKTFKTPETFIFSYSVAAYHDAPTGNVTGLKINEMPEKTTYYAGKYFDRAGLTLTADGISTLFHADAWEPSGPLTVEDKEITITIGGQTVTVPITVRPGNELTDAEVLDETGQFIYKPFLLDETQYELPNQMEGQAESEIGKGRIVAANGATEVKVELTLADAAIAVYLNDEEEAEQKVEGDDTKCTITLPVEKKGGTKVTLKKDGEADKTYTLYVHGRSYSGLPDKVVDFIVPNSQYTNTGNSWNRYIGMNGVATLIGGTGTTSDLLYSTPTTLGNFGGHITYYYKKPIVNDPKNPYGIDFVAVGNMGPAAEPGVVWVSEDNIIWYALAGSKHYEDTVDWKYSVTYENNNGTTKVTTSDGESAISTFQFPWKERYPLFDWGEDENKFTLTGILGGGGDFGYVDNHDQESSNESANPYDGGTKGQREGFDLAWAVDTTGQPVDVSDKEFHYVKIQTATNSISDSFGDASTEVNMVRVAAAAEAEVGATDAPAAVTVAGKTVTFGENNVTNDVAVSGAFLVRVNAGGDANVYINDLRTTSRAYSAIPEHKMIRVIVQEGEKEPWIGYINLVEDESGEAASAMKVTFDANGGTLEGPGEITYMAGMDEEDLVFPIPTREKREFLGWFDENGNKYDKYEAGMPATLTLTAQWKYILSEGEAPEVNVSFRLIGSTLAKGEDGVDLSKGEEGYNGAEYQTWIATHDYTLPAGSTVIDLVNMATKAVGIELKNPKGNYITEIKAPESLGGYWLGEKTNGDNSGWMYTLDGKHGDLGVAQQDLADGNKVIFHYVNDYVYEAPDWGGGDIKDGPLVGRWLEAEDKNPEGINPDPPTVDKTDLNAAIEKAEALQTKDYTVDSWKALADALTDAKAVQSDKDATREEVDAATKALTEATKALVKKPAKEMPFTDLISADGKAHWATDAIEYVYQTGLMKGMSDTTFAPDVPLTRGMLVAMLYRLEKEPAVTGTSPFTDVAADTWYTDAVTWANAEGIVKGVSETSFAPNQEITREQMVTMLYRYANVKKYDTTARAELNAYTDAASVNDYAVDAMCWSVKTGLIHGMTETTLVPRGNATRAQTAMVLTFFMENVVK